MMERVQPEVGQSACWQLHLAFSNYPKPSFSLSGHVKCFLWQVAGVAEEEEVEPARGHEDGLRGHEDERIAAILERIQAIKPEYKHR